MSTQETIRQCFAVLVDNQPGVLARVVGMFAGRGYNIESLAVDKVNDQENLSRITIVSKGTQTILDQIGAQLGRLVPVRHAVNLSREGALVERVYAMLKVIGDEAQQDKAADIITKAGGHVLHQENTSCIFEISALPEQMDTLIAELSKCGLAEIARSGSVAMNTGTTTL